MRRRSLTSAAILMVASMSMATTALAFSGISNGSFEAGTFSGAPIDELTTGSSALTDWTIASGSIDAIGSYWVASDGLRSIDLNGGGPGAISQALATTVGNTYTVSFDLSGNPVCGPVIKTGTISATGGPSGALSFDTSLAGNTPADMKWVAQTFVFVATTAPTTLTFASTTDGPCGPALDNVVVTETAPTPEPPPPASEPATLADCKDGGWMALVDGAENHFKNQGDCVSYVASDGRNVAAGAVNSNLPASQGADKVRSEGASLGDAAQPGKGARKLGTPAQPKATPAVIPSGHGSSR
jgi:choice-of-anchor C domain-containing protein